MSTDLKELLAVEVVSRVKDGDTIGVGTGTTVNAVLESLRKRVVDEGMRLKVVPTSYQTLWLCEEIGLDVLPMDHPGAIGWGFDGADEVDSRRRAIKGRGGALLTEKQVAKRCQKYTLIITEEKQSNRLGEISPVPIEVVPELQSQVKQALKSIGAKNIELRNATYVGRSGPYFTQHGNIIIDANFSDISDSLEEELNGIEGVVDNGIFTSYATEVLVSKSTGIESY